MLTIRFVNIGHMLVSHRNGIEVADIVTDVDGSWHVDFGGRTGLLSAETLREVLGFVDLLNWASNE